MAYAVITTDGNVEFHAGIPTTDDMQAVVDDGCGMPGHNFLDCIYFDSNVSETRVQTRSMMWFNDEARHLKLEINPVATRLMREWIGPDNTIRGDVVVAGRGPKGEVTSLAEAMTDRIIETLGQS